MLLYRLPILNDLAVTLDHYKKLSVETLAPPQGVRFYLWLVTEYSGNVVYLPRNCALAEKLHKGSRHFPLRSMHSRDRGPLGFG